MRAAKCPKCGASVPVAAGATQVQCPGCSSLLRVTAPVADRPDQHQQSACPPKPADSPSSTGKTRPTASPSIVSKESDIEQQRQSSAQSETARSHGRAVIKITVGAVVVVGITVAVFSRSSCNSTPPELVELDKQLEAIQAEDTRKRERSEEYARNTAERSRKFQELQKTRRQSVDTISDAERTLDDISIRLTNAKAVFDIWQEDKTAREREAQRQEWQKRAGVGQVAYRGKTPKEWTRQLKAEDAFIRADAAEVLADMGEAASAVVPELTEALMDPEGRVRSGAIRALGNTGIEAKSAIPAIAKAVKDEYSGLKAVETLGKLGPIAKEAVPQLMELLATPDSSYDIRYIKDAAVVTLGEIGPDAKAALPLLLDELKGDRQTAAMIALGKLKEPEAVPYFIAALDDQDWQARQAAAQALRSVGTPAKAAVPKLVSELLAPENAHRPDMLKILVEALAQIGPDAKESLQILINLMKDKNFDGNGRAACARALPQIDPLGEESIPALLKVFEERPWIDLDHSILEALGNYGPGAKEVLPALQAAAEKGANNKAMATCLYKIGGEDATLAWINELQKQKELAAKKVQDLNEKLEKVRRESKAK